MLDGDKNICVNLNIDLIIEYVILKCFVFYKYIVLDSCECVCMNIYIVLECIVLYVFLFILYFKSFVMWIVIGY